MSVPHQDFQLIAHRGYQLHYPENTLLAFKKAVEAGARFVETDIQFSRDKQPVLFHDRNLSRICSRQGCIGDYTFDELKTFSAHEPKRFADKFRAERIASLDGFIELMRKHPHVHCFVEIKRTSLELFSLDDILDILFDKLSALKNPVTLISFSMDAMLAARRRHGQNLGMVITDWQQIHSPLLAELNPEYVFADNDFLPKQGDLQLPCGKLVIYEVANPAQAVRLAGRGAEFIETFAIGEMLSGIANPLGG